MIGLKQGPLVCSPGVTRFSLPPGPLRFSAMGLLFFLLVLLLMVCVVCRSFLFFFFLLFSSFFCSPFFFFFSAFFNYPFCRLSWSCVGMVFFFSGRRSFRPTVSRPFYNSS